MAALSDRSHIFRTFPGSRIGRIAPSAAAARKACRETSVANIRPASSTHLSRAAANRNPRSDGHRLSMNSTASCGPSTFTVRLSPARTVTAMSQSQIFDRVISFSAQQRGSYADPIFKMAARSTNAASGQLRKARDHRRDRGERISSMNSLPSCPDTICPFGPEAMRIALTGGGGPI